MEIYTERQKFTSETFEYAFDFWVEILVLDVLNF